MHMVNKEKSIAEEIKSLRSLGMSVQGIADTLNEKGLKSGFTDKLFTAAEVRSLMHRQGMSLKREAQHLDASGDAEIWLTAGEKMTELGISSKNVLRNMRLSGELVSMPVTKSNRFLYKAENVGSGNGSKYPANELTQ